MPPHKAAGVSYVLDTSAVIAYLAGERGSAGVEALKSISALPFMALSELYYVVWQKKDKAEADRMYGLVRGWHLPILYPTERTVLIAGRLKVVWKLGIADSYIAAIAKSFDLTLLTKDPDYKKLQSEIRLRFLG